MEADREHIIVKHEWVGNISLDSTVLESFSRIHGGHWTMYFLCIYFVLVQILFLFVFVRKFVPFLHWDSFPPLFLVGWSLLKSSWLYFWYYEFWNWHYNSYLVFSIQWNHHISSKRKKNKRKIYRSLFYSAPSIKELLKHYNTVGYVPVLGKFSVLLSFSVALNDRLFRFAKGYSLHSTK